MRPLEGREILEKHFATLYPNGLLLLLLLLVFENRPHLLRIGNESCDDAECLRDFLYGGLSLGQSLEFLQRLQDSVPALIPHFWSPDEKSHPLFQLWHGTNDEVIEPLLDIFEKIDTVANRRLDIGERGDSPIMLDRGEPRGMLLEVLHPAHFDGTKLVAGQTLERNPDLREFDSQVIQTLNGCRVTKILT